MTTTRERDKWKKFFNWADSEVAKANERLQAENAVLKQKLEEAREWVKLYDPDWDNDINKLKKILD